MAATQNIETFAKSETVEITVNSKDRSGTTLNLTGATVHFTIADKKVAESSLLVELTQADPQVTISDAAGGVTDIVLDKTDLTSLTEDVTYFWSFWTDTSGGTRLLQVQGTFKLLSAVQPTT